MFLCFSFARFYSVIDNEIRKIKYDRGVTVFMLMSNWTSSDPQQISFLTSLKAFGAGLAHVKGTLNVVRMIFIVCSIHHAPLTVKNIPLSPTYHSKFNELVMPQSKTLSQGYINLECCFVSPFVRVSL